MLIRKINKEANEYPPSLREISSAPKQLYAIGAEITSDRPRIAIVGSRKATAYGRDVTKLLAGELAAAGIVIVSGLALGIDAIAHTAALETGGQTIAVQACGLDRIYPATNRQLGERIIKQNGTIVSEYPIGTPPLVQHFPARNRIIAGLSQGVLVTEAAKESGSLITAAFALEQNREVFAVPGPINGPMSAGTNELIKRGAQVVTSAKDVLDALGIAAESGVKAKGANEQEELILNLLDQGIQDMEELAIESALSINKLGQTLTMMELSGLIRPLGAGKWARS